MKYLALLRGINVGGNRRVPMAELKSLFEELGFSDVSTYINSGNVIFSSQKSKINVSQIEQKIEQHFKFKVDVLVLNQEDVAKIAAKIPDAWDHKNDRSNICYLFDELNSPNILEQIKFNKEFENLIYINHALLHSIPLKYYSRSSLAKLIGTPIYKKMTVRNVNTARKLAELMR